MIIVAALIVSLPAQAKPVYLLCKGEVRLSYGHPPTPEVRSIIIDREAGTVEVADYGWGKITNQDAAGILYFAEKENYDFRGYVNSVTGKAEVAVGGMVFQGTCQPTKPLF